MKISTTYRAALVAASALSILAPAQALAAEASACTTENITYLDSQDKQEDSEAKVTSAQRAYDQARDDRAAFGKVKRTANDLFDVFEKMETGNGRSQNGPVVRAALDVDEAAERLDAAATADAAVAEADAGQKALDSMTEGDKLEHGEGRRAEVASRLIRQLRTEAERVRKATTAKDVEARKADLDTAVSEKADADKGVRPARDAYRDCLAKANG